jgi:hypothetical protein
MSLLSSGRVDDQTIRSGLEALIDKLDGECFAAKEIHDKGEGQANTYRTLFSKARAASALMVGFNANPFAAAGEAIYEASSALGIDDVEVLVYRLLADDRRAGRGNVQEC